MIAIPVMHGRVAPVLNWCSRMLLFSDTPGAGEAQELSLPEQRPEERLRLLQEKGVKTLICGALSPGLQNFAAQLGLQVIPGVAGGVAEVLEAYWQKRLDQPEFWVPGCRGPQRYRQRFWEDHCPAVPGRQGGEGNVPGIRGGGNAGLGPGRGCQSGTDVKGGFRSGPRQGMPENCICPACGAKAQHRRGIPCIQVQCPQCGRPMVRE